MYELTFTAEERFPRDNPTYQVDHEGQARANLRRAICEKLAELVERCPDLWIRTREFRESGGTLAGIPLDAIRCEMHISSPTPLEGIQAPEPPDWRHPFSVSEDFYAR